MGEEVNFRSRIIFLLVILAAYLLPSCGGETAAPVPDSTPQPVIITPTQKQSHTPTATLQASATPLPTATVRSNTLPIKEITEDCADWVEWDSSRLSSESALIFVDFDPAKDRKSFSSLSPIAGVTRPLPELPGFLKSFGPPTNSKRFAYINEQMQVVLSNANGEIESVSPFKSYWHSALAWIDDQSLLVSYDPVATSERNVDVFNVATGQIQVLSPDLTDIFTFQAEDTGHFVWKMIYDPTRTRLTYTREAENIAVTMINAETGAVLWELERSSTGLDYPPIWSRDGSKMAVIASGDPEFSYQNFEVFLVDREGTGTQWVDLREMPEITASDYQWSPDGRYLAIYGTSIFVLDTQEQRLVDTCVPLTETGYYLGQAEPILWSPDSQHLIYQREDSAVLVDLLKGTVTSLTGYTNLLPVSWLATTP